MVFEESNLRFTFQDDEWWVKQFDDKSNVIYKKVADKLQGTKAVDFVGIHNSDKLFFFEIKNFKGHTADSDTRVRLESQGEVLTTEIAQKVRDSLACILAGSRNATNDIEKWKQICKLISNNNPVRIIAWIEQDTPAYTGRSNVQGKKVKVELSVRTSKLKNKLSWLTSRVFIESISGRQSEIKGLSIEYI